MTRVESEQEVEHSDGSHIASAKLYLRVSETAEMGGTKGSRPPSRDETSNFKDHTPLAEK